jgi:hypothetical protein
MSVNVLKLIPNDPEFIPSAEAQQRAKDLLASLLPLATEISVEITADVNFIDQGQNFERAFCPQCGTIVDLSWWQSAMDKAHVFKFNNLTVEMPCCGTTSSLNDLHYEWPAGFARFVLEAHNPNADLDSNQILSLEAIIGTPLRKIRARY